MDRRRFVPLSLSAGQEIALEQRTMLSTTTTGTLFGTPSTVSGAAAASDIADNLQQRLERIQNLPFFMSTFAQGRPLPSTVITPIQDDLRALIALGHNAPSSVLNQFNLTIRSVSANQSLSPLHAQSLVNAFHSVLRYTGVHEPLLSKFTGDMTALANLESQGPTPMVLAINDFATITQLVQALAHPFAAPGDPALVPVDLIKHSHNLTNNHQPSFYGNAADGVFVNLVDNATGQIVGTSLATTLGKYKVTLNYPLPDGTYTVQAQTQDDGYTSLLSHRYTFKITSYVVGQKTPKGPG